MKSKKSLLFFLVAFLFIQNCSKDSSSTNDINNDLNNIEVLYIYGEGNADFMPPVVPDPIHIRIEMEFKNLSNSKTIKNIDIENEKVFLLENDSLIGEIDLYPWEEIVLSPSEIDTIIFSKTSCDSMPFDAPDKKYIYIDLDIVDKFGNRMNFVTDSIYFECTY